MLVWLVIEWMQPTRVNEKNRNIIQHIYVLVQRTPPSASWTPHHSAARTREVEFERAPFLSLSPSPSSLCSEAKAPSAMAGRRRAPKSQPPPPASTPLAARPAALLSRRRRRPSTKPAQTPRDELLRPSHPVLSSSPSRASAPPADLRCSLVQLIQSSYKLHLTVAYFTTAVWV